MAAKKLAKPKAKASKKAPKSTSRKGPGRPLAEAKQPTKEEKKTGRPSKRTPEVVAEILARLSEGEFLVRICRDEHLPSRRQFVEWMQNDKVLSSQVVCARELGVEAILEEATDIADDGRNDWIEQLGPEGQCEGWRLNGEHVQRSRLRIETRLKLAEKMLPKKYGPALKLAGDPNNDTPIPVGIVMIPPKAKAGG